VGDWGYGAPSARDVASPRPFVICSLPEPEPAGAYPCPSAHSKTRDRKSGKNHKQSGKKPPGAHPSIDYDYGRLSD